MSGAFLALDEDSPSSAKKTLDMLKIQYDLGSWICILTAQNVYVS